MPSPQFLLAALLLTGAVGVVLVVCGAALDNAPLSTAGGVFIGFAYGYYLSRKTLVRALNQAAEDE